MKRELILMIENELKINEENRMYRCTEDYQGTDFCVGLTKTVSEWRTAALEWVDCGGFSDDVEIMLHELTGQALIDYISDVWEIELEEIK